MLKRDEVSAITGEANRAEVVFNNVISNMTRTIAGTAEDIGAVPFDPSAAHAFPPPIAADAAEPYRGMDRRATVSRMSPRALVLIAAGLGVGFGVIGAERVLGESLLPHDVALSLSSTTDSMAISVSLLAVAALLARHRTTPERCTTMTASLMALVAAVVMPVDLVITRELLGSTSGFAAVARVGIAIVGSLLIRRTVLDGAGTFGRGVAGVVAATWLLGSLVSVTILAFGVDAYEVRFLTLGIGAGVLLALGFVLGATGLRRGERRLTSVAMLLVALAAADATSVLPDEAFLGLVTGKLMRLFVVAAVLLLTVLELRDLAIDERERALRADHESVRAADRLVIELSQRERFAHDARSALLAIQGGLRAIGDDAGGEQRMLAAVESEVSRLRTILTNPTETHLPHDFDMSAALRPMVECYAAAGHPVSLKAERAYWARGRQSDAVEVTQNLIENALHHASNTDVVVWVYESEGVVCVRVGDRGKGVPGHLRDEIFSHGHSGGAGSGVGLHISRTLVESQGGTLTVEDRSGGGALFTFTTPRPNAARHLDLVALETGS